MKQINKYIVERLHINKDTGNHYHNYNYQPKTRVRAAYQSLFLHRAPEETERL